MIDWSNNHHSESEDDLKLAYDLLRQAKSGFDKI